MSTTTAAGQLRDPVLAAVLSNRMESVVREMSNTLLRTGRAAILNTARDFSCSIVTADNELLASAEGLPIHIVGSQYLTAAMSRLHPDFAEGDAFLHNDPYNGNTHHADHSILVPVFWEGRHVFTAVAKAHQADCGNSQPTTYASYARDVYEEGALTFPCVRIQRGRVDDPDIVRMCRARIRVPDQWYGDYLAALGAARIGERRLHDVLERYGADVLEEFCREWLDYSERRMDTAIRQLPAGRIHAEGMHDAVPGSPDGIPLEVDIDVDPAAGVITVDLTRNVDCLPSGFNQSEATAIGSVIIGVFNQLTGEIPHNDGSFRRIKVLLRENCVAGIPVHPTSCSCATTNVTDRMINIIQSAFAELGDGYGIAEGAVGMGPGFGVISGNDSRRNGEPYINQVYFASAGGPAAPEEDGWLFYGLPVCGGLMYRDSVEIAEQKHPFLIREVRVLRDSEGAGRFRGGMGCRVAFGPTSDPMTVAYLADGADHPPKGARGGLDGMARDVYKRDQHGTRTQLPRVDAVELQPGEIIVDVGPGGGGYGAARERDPERVRADVLAGFVSVGRAREVYGVELDPDGAVDAAATAALRGTA